MKKTIFLVLLFLSMLTLIACGSLKEKMTLLDHIGSISISKSQGYGAVNKDYFIIQREEDKIASFEQIMSSVKGKKKDIIENINEDRPDYDIVVDYKNGKNHLLHLILGQEGEGSIFMYVGQEEIPYYTSVKETKILREIINNRKSPL